MNPTRALSTLLIVAGVWSPAAFASEFKTADPLRAFVYGQYERGSDYFPRESAPTRLVRCAVPIGDGSKEYVALSEMGIWGNGSGPFELFLRTGPHEFVYERTADYDTELKSKCAAKLESCAYTPGAGLDSCKWQPGLGR